MLKPVLTCVDACFQVHLLVAGDLIKFERSSFYYVVVWNDDYKKELHYQMHGGDRQFCKAYSYRCRVSLFGFVEKEVSHA